jgi:predicted RNA-binding protein Jag
MTPEVRQSVQNILNLIVLGIDPEAKIDLEKEGDQWRISIESHSKNDLVGEKGETQFNIILGLLFISIFH